MLLGSGYIAGASIALMIVAFFNFNTDLVTFLDLTKNESVPSGVKHFIESAGGLLTLLAFGALAVTAPEDRSPKGNGPRMTKRV